MKQSVLSIVSVTIFLGVLLAACGDDSGNGADADQLHDVALSESGNGGSDSYYSSNSRVSDDGVDSVYDVVTGTLTDSRDGQTYRTVKIGDQVWMAENLNYAYTGVPFDYDGYTSDSTSWCYNNDPAYCETYETYGRLYTWAAAMDSVGEWSTNGKGCGYYGKECSPTYPVRGICPKGWHLPSGDEWEALILAVGGYSTADTKLRSATDWGDLQISPVTYIGTDAYSFSALPAGGRDRVGNFFDKRIRAYFWGSTEITSYYATNVYLGDCSDEGPLGADNKYLGFSVRCLKDNSEIDESQTDGGGGSSGRNSGEGNNDSSSSQSVNGNDGKSSDSNSGDSNGESSGSWVINASAGSIYDEVTGILTDLRDGQTYRTTTIAPVGTDYSEVWMAENLNYAYTSVPYDFYGARGYDVDDSTSWCYDRDLANCEIYGRLYTWAAAMDSVGEWSTNGKGCGYDYGKECSPTYPVRGICPEGWHLPSKAEWETLVAALGYMAGVKLKSVKGWDYYDDVVRGTNTYSFSALPAGYRINASFSGENAGTYFWSSTECTGDNYCSEYNWYAYAMALDFRHYDAEVYDGNKRDGLSVRCIKD